MIGDTIPNGSLPSQDPSTYMKCVRYPCTPEEVAREEELQSIRERESLALDDLAAKTAEVGSSTVKKLEELKEKARLLQEEPPGIGITPYLPLVALAVVGIGALFMFSKKS